MSEEEDPGFILSDPAPDVCAHASKLFAVPLSIQKSFTAGDDWVDIPNDCDRGCVVPSEDCIICVAVHSNYHRLETDAGDLLFLKPGTRFQCEKPGIQVQIFTFVQRGAAMAEPERLFKRHVELQKDIDALNHLAWNSSRTATANMSRDRLQKDVTNEAALKNYRETIRDLEVCLAQAQEEERTVLPVLLEQLESAKRSLEAMKEDLPAAAKQQHRQIEKCTKDLEAFTNAKWDLVGSAKKVEAFMESLTKLEADVQQRKEALSSKRKKPEAEPETSTILLHGKDGSTGWNNELTNYGRVIGTFNGKVKELNDPAFTELVSQFDAAYGEVRAFIKKHPPAEHANLTVDVTKSRACMNAINAYLEQTATKKKTRTATVKCSSCSMRRVNYQDSGKCKECFNGKVEFNSEPEEDSKGCYECGKDVFEQASYCFKCLRENLDVLIDPIDTASGNLFKLSEKDEAQYGPLYAAYELLSEKISKAAKTFESKQNIREAIPAWRTLHGLLEEAKKQLAPYGKFSSEEEEDDEEYDDNDGGSSFEQPDSEEVEYEEGITKEDSLAHDLVVTMHRLPVSQMRDELMSWYLDKKKHPLLVARLEDLKEVDKVYAVRITAPNSTKPSFHHTCFFKEDEAASVANKLAASEKEFQVEVIEKKV